MTATGTAMVSAASVEAPERIANAVAMILPNAYIVKSAEERADKCSTCSCGKKRLSG